MSVSPIPPALGAVPQPHCLWGAMGGSFPHSICKSDERGCFLYVVHMEEDFQLYFPSQQHCQW